MTSHNCAIHGTALGKFLYATGARSAWIHDHRAFERLRGGFDLYELKLKCLAIIGVGVVQGNLKARTEQGYPVCLDDFGYRGWEIEIAWCPL